MRQRLLFWSCRPGGGFGRAAIKRHHGERQLRLLVPPWTAYIHGRHRPHCLANPVSKVQWWCGQGICEVEVRNSISRGGQMRISGEQDGKQKDGKSSPIFIVDEHVDSFLDLWCVLAAVDCLVVGCHFSYITAMFSPWFFFLFVCFLTNSHFAVFLKHPYYLLFSKQPHKCWLTQASHSTAVSQVSDHLLSYLTLFVAPLSSAGAARWACHSLKGTDDARSCWRAKQISALPWCRDCAITPPHPKLWPSVLCLTLCKLWMCEVGF